MMETSTPLVVVNKNLDIASLTTPLRRRSSLALRVASPIVLLERSDDNIERQQRRDSVLIQKRLSNLSPKRSANDSVSDDDAKKHMQMCLKLFAENKITVTNAWSLKIIDYLHKVANKESLQVAGTSLDVSARVLGVRIDNVHTEGMQLASSIIKSANKPKEDDTENVDENAEEDRENEPTRKTKKKKRRLGQKSTVAKDPSQLILDTIPQLEDNSQFQTCSRTDFSAVDNLFTGRLHRGADGKFVFNESEKAWISYNTVDDSISKTAIVEVAQDKLPQMGNFKLNPPFGFFDFAKWNPEDDKFDMEKSSRLENDVVVYDEQGIPVPELDGSVHDIFADDNEPLNDNDEELLEEDRLDAQLQGNIAHIVDFKDAHTSALSNNEYSYNLLVYTQSGKVMEQIWAGPSHWKLKCIRPSTSRFSGRSEKQEEHRPERKRREKAEPQKILALDDVEIDMRKCKPKKYNSEPIDYSRYTLQIVDEYEEESIQKEMKCLMTKSCMVRVKTNGEEERDCEVGPYNYNNLNDSQYCLQTSMADANGDNNCDDDFDNGNDMDNMDNADGNMDMNAIDMPEMVQSCPIQYAKFAKKMNMKKLKTAVWECITDKNINPNQPEEEHVKTTTFSKMYEELPRHLTISMKTELSCPLALFALLHLANEHNLKLDSSADLKDISIQQN